MDFRLYLACFFLLITISCSQFSKNKKKPIAKYKAETLYLEDIQNQIKPFLSSDDSSNQIKSIVNKWLSYQTLLNAADKNLGDSTEHFQKLIDDYKNSLFIYHYESNLSKTKMDTSVLDTVVRKYYQDNSANFELKRNIARIWYAKFPKSFVNYTNIVPFFKEGKAQSVNYIKEYCGQYANNYFVSSIDWLYFDEIAREVPIDPQYDQLAYMQNNPFKIFEDENYYYLLRIIDYKVKNTVSPIELVYTQIKQMIINERKVSLLNKNQNELLNEAIKKGDAKIY